MNIFGQPRCSFAYFEYQHSKIETFDHMDSKPDNEMELREYKLNSVSRMYVDC
jgi:hypothetical protein